MDDAAGTILTDSLKKSEKNLNDAYQRFHQNKSSSDNEFFEIKLQCCIFQFDLCREMVSVYQQQHTGFAGSASLKGLVHKLFEYEALVKNHLRGRLLELAARRNIQVDREALAELDAHSKPALKALRKWNSVRNKAAGHYDSDLRLQVELIESLRYDQVFDTACAFVQYNMGLLFILRDAGQGLVRAPLP